MKKNKTNLRNVLEIKKKPITDKQTSNKPVRKEQKPLEPVISVGILQPDLCHKLLTSVGQHFRIKAASMYNYMYGLLVGNISHDHRFNNKYQLVRLYKKQEKIFDHGNVFYSLIKKGNKFLKRSVFIKELPIIDYESYLDIVDDYKQNDPRYPSYFGQEINKNLYNYGNASYIDIFSHYLCSRLVEEGITPHFPLFYGAVNTYFDKYTYKFGDDDEFKKFMSRFDWEYQTDNYKIIIKDDKKKVEIKGAPVYLMATEVMDYDFAEFVETTNQAYLEFGKEDFDTVDYEKTIQSVLFQTICALTLINEKWNLIHNDLHLGNIMFQRTDQTHLNYRYKNLFFRVPTFGMIVKIIDWNRATLTFGGVDLKNKVYDMDNNCAEMYYWPTGRSNRKPVVLPNASFDLGLLAFELLREDHIIPKSSKTHKLLMEWLTTDNGENLYNDMGREEEDPGFQLYIAIAHFCHKGIPANQFHKAIWNSFKVDKSRIPKGEKIYVVSD